MQMLEISTNDVYTEESRCIDSFASQDILSHVCKMEMAQTSYFDAHCEEPTTRR